MQGLYQQQSVALWETFIEVPIHKCFSGPQNYNPVKGSGFRDLGNLGFRFGVSGLGELGFGVLGVGCRFGVSGLIRDLYIGF